MVAGLGPAGPELVTAATLEAIARIPHRYLRTARHPAAAALGGVHAFDDVYDGAATLDDVYHRIVEELVAATAAHGEVLYLVPGSPAVAERTVELLRADERVETDVLPAPSFLELAWDRLGVDPLAAGVRLVDGRRFAVESAGERGPLLIAQCDSRRVLSDIKLALEDGPDLVPSGGAGRWAPTVTVLQGLGLPGERVFDVAWDELDRAFEPDHLTSLWVAELAAPVAQELARFAELVRTLRQRCPWDREQTHQSLTRHLLEETYEALEALSALDASDPPAEAFEHLREELGDLLFQVCFHATLAAEAGQFTLADVARGVHDKLVHRHPHVFGSLEAETAGQVMANWERIKQVEKARESVMDGIPPALPSLLYAHKVQRRAASVGFDWDSVEGAYPKVTEELAELRADPGEEELGDLLFAVVNVARHLDLDPEAALRRAAAKFRDRFGAVERLASDRGMDLATTSLGGLDALWDEVKRAG
ncbi:MAG: nucleoside triphosphate pyrophosphohydrolase [Actinomycetota bacterium]|nr:nucleoside triphosphate pyrophosphohydrolase [Actinomycetota bacterium]